MSWDDQAVRLELHEIMLAPYDEAKRTVVMTAAEGIEIYPLVEGKTRARKPAVVLSGDPGTGPAARAALLRRLADLIEQNGDSSLVKLVEEYRALKVTP